MTSPSRTFIRAGRLLLALALFSAPARAPAQKLWVRNYTNASGFPATQVFTAAQDARGYLWFGTPNGLIRYDGAEFKVFGVRDGLAAPSVRSLQEHEGALWMATEGGVSRFDGVRFHNYSAKDGLGAGIVWRAASHGDALWFGTNDGGLSRYQGGRFTTFTEADGLPSNRVFALLSDGAALWVGTRGGGLSRHDGASFRNFGPADGLDGREISALVRLGTDLWVGTRDKGLFRLVGERFEQVLPDAPIYCGAAVGGELWFGTLGKGVLRLTPDGQVTQYTTDHGLASNRVYSVFEDREGAIWFLTSAGLSKLISEKFLRYSEGINVLATAEFGGATWLGTLGEGLLQLKDGKTARFGRAEGLLDDSVWSLAVHQGELWIGTSRGLNRWNGERFTALTSKDGLLADTAMHLLSDGPSLWISTSSGATRWDGKEFRHWTQQEGLVSTTLRSAARDGERICFSGEGGLSCIDPSGAVTRYTREDGLPGNGTYHALRDAQGVLWVGTNAGLARLEGKRFVAANELEDDMVAALASYDGKLYAGTSRGVAVLEGGKEIARFSVGRGLPGNEVNSAGIRVDLVGHVWIATTSGATVYRPELDLPNRAPPRVALQRLAVDGEAVPLEAAPPLGPEPRSLLFRFAGLSFRDESDVTFSYRLDGFDRQWSARTPERQARYTNLAEGNYRFEVVAYNAQGTASPPAQLGFTVVPPMWRTWWFRLAAAAIVVAVLLLLLRAAIYARTLQVRQRNVELDRLVRQRTEELDKAVGELKELSLTDPLTGVRNRRFFAETVGAELSRIERHVAGEKRGARSPPTRPALAFLLIDLDHFKRINDQHGHEVGDRVLRRVAEVIQGTLRGSDTVVRWGGEEFLAVCRDPHRENILDLARRIVAAIAATPVALEGGLTLSVTACCGFACYPFYDSAPQLLSYEDVIVLSDRALYMAKRSGRDTAVGVVAGEKVPSEAERAKLKDDPAGVRSAGFVRIETSTPDRLSL